MKCRLRGEILKIFQITFVGFLRLALRPHAQDGRHRGTDDAVVFRVDEAKHHRHRFDLAEHVEQPVDALTLRKILPILPALIPVSLLERCLHLVFGQSAEHVGVERGVVVNATDDVPHLAPVRHHPPHIAFHLVQTLGLAIPMRRHLGV